MKLIAILRKSFTEQIRQFWILILTITMAPAFVGIYYLIYESTKLNLQVNVVNQDKHLLTDSSTIDYGSTLVSFLSTVRNDTMPVRFNYAVDRATAEDQIRTKKTNGMIIIPAGFSDSIRLRQSGVDVQVPFEISGNLTETYYLLSAVLSITYVSGYINEVTGTRESYRYTETAAGQSSNLDDYTLAIPGLLILATIMLMFSCTIAFVAEPEKKTMLRLKLSKLKTGTFLTGVTIIQVLVGLLSILLTLGVASLLGFSFSGSIWLFLLICILTCLSIIGFSLILAGMTKTVTEVLVVGNFPLLLFMFFSGAMFPVHGATLFTLGGYDFTVPGLMSSYHGIDALKQVLIFNAGFAEIWPQVVCLSGLSIIYFLVGYYDYRRRHMRIF